MSETQRPLDEIEHELTSLAARIAAATARFLEALAEFDARGGWAVDGIVSCAQWLSWRCGMAPGTAREHVRVARSLTELPQLREALATGDVSFSKARAITRIATPETEGELVSIGRNGTAQQVESVVRGIRRVARVEGAAETGEPLTYFRHRWDDDGTLYVQGRLNSVDGATFLAALSSALESLDARSEVDTAEGPAAPAAADVPAGTPEEQDPAGSRRTTLEAFVAVAQSALDHTPVDGPSSRRPDVVVHVDADVLTSQDQPGETSTRCRLDDGPGLTAEVARQLACDGGIVLHAHGPDGSSLALGRRSRRPNAAIMRALWYRDRGCIHPACGRRRYLHAHHVVHWAHGGPTDLTNLVLLCSRHHRDVHAGTISVLWDDGGRPRVANGSEAIKVAPMLPAPRPGEPVDLEDVLADLSELARASGERLDRHYAVGAVFDAWQARGAWPPSPPSGPVGAPGAA